MKKFLLSLCAIAVASACVFMTSCKDDDEWAEQINVPSVANAVASAQAAGVTAGLTYSYQLNGQEYTSPEALQQAIAALEPGSQNNTLVVVAKDPATGASQSGKVTTFSVPAVGGQPQQIVFNIPTTTNPTDDGSNNTATISITTTETRQHSGGTIN